MKKMMMSVLLVGAFSGLTLAGCADVDAGQSQNSQENVETAQQALGSSRAMHVYYTFSGSLVVDSYNDSSLQYWAGFLGFPISIDDYIPTGASSGWIYINFTDGTGRWEWIADMYSDQYIYQHNNAHYFRLKLENQQWRALNSGGGPGYSYYQLIEYTGHY